MRKRLTFLLALVLYLHWATPPPVQAMRAINTPCGDGYCDTEAGEDYYNCHEDCEEPGGGCNPNYQPSGGMIGAFAVDYWFANYCEHYVAYQHTWHDVNECPGSSDYTTCYHAQDGSIPAAGYCCSFYYCGGSQCS